jgi:hypothetical protein
MREPILSRMANRKQRAKSGAETVICLYRVKAGNEAKFQRLLERHWPTLRALRLVTARKPRHFRGAEDGGGPLFVEIFDWVDGEAAGLAHTHPEIAAIWEPMDGLCEARAGKPNMEFPHVRPIEVALRA